MIVFGTANKEIAKEHIIDKCPNCGAQNSIEMHLFQEHVHIFWIPFFPNKRTGVSQCERCKQILQLSQMPASLRTAYENLKAQTRTPIWTFAGSGLISLVMISCFIFYKQKEKRNAELILVPQAGDIFEIKTKDNFYTLYKVDQVKGDSVFIQVNNYQVNQETGLSDLKRKGYSDEIYTISKKELKEMFKSGEVIDIDRK